MDTHNYTHIPLDAHASGGKTRRRVSFSIPGVNWACDEFEGLEPMTTDEAKKAGYYFWTHHTPEPFEESVRAGIRDFCAERAARRRRGALKRTAEQAELEQRADFEFPRVTISPPSPPPPRPDPSFFLFDH